MIQTCLRNRVRDDHWQEGNQNWGIFIRFKFVLIVNLIFFLVENEERQTREENELQRQISLLDAAIEETANRTKCFKQWENQINQLIPQFAHTSLEDDEIKQEAVCVSF